MRAAVIKVADILVDYPLRMTFAKKHDVIQTFMANAAQKALTNRIGTRCLERPVEQFDVSASRCPLEAKTVLVIIVANQEAWSFPKGGRLAYLLVDSSIAWTARDRDM